MATIYSTSLSAEETVFAELCLDTSDIVLEEPHVIDIVAAASNNAGLESSEHRVPITRVDFERMFYGQQIDVLDSSPSFDSAFQLTGSGSQAIVYYQLDRQGGDSQQPFYSLLNGIGVPTDQTVNLVKPVTDFWVKDTGYALDCWSTCSYMSIAKEIDTTHNLQNLDCNVCCSLCYGELLGLLDAKRPGYSNDPSLVRPQRTKVAVGDKVGLRVLYKNAFEGVKNVEIRIHYLIIDEST